MSLNVIGNALEMEPVKERSQKLALSNVGPLKKDNVKMELQQLFHKHGS